MNAAATRFFYFVPLFRAEQPVARVAKAGHYVAMVVKIVVHMRNVDVHVVMRRLHGLYALGRGYQVHQLYVLAARALYNVYRRIGSTIIMSRSSMSEGSLQ